MGDALWNLTRNIMGEENGRKYLPLIGTFPQTPQPDAGVVPDVIASISPTDIATGRDSVMETALAIASRA